MSTPTLPHTSLTPDRISSLRSLFPAVNRGEAIFFDNPGGTQVPQTVIDAVADYYATRCANVGGAFETSRRTDAVIQSARAGLADLIGAPDPATIVVGQSMTALTFHLARSLAHEMRPGDEVIVTDLDHDANISPWRDLEAVGVVVRTIPFRTEDGTVDFDALSRALRPGKTRLLAIGQASNALGTITDVTAAARMAKEETGALVFVDGVQSVPHLPVDVMAMGVDFLACSAYKFFGPHMGALYGRREHLERFVPHKVRPAKDSIPYRWEQGTLNHEGLAGIAAAVAYLEGIGTGPDRRTRLQTALTAVREYEQSLSERLLTGLTRISGVRVYGIADPARSAERVPTVAFTRSGETPRAICERLWEQGRICCWNGNYYAVRVMETLGLEESGGAVRVGLAHYNTPAEIDRFLEVLAG